MNDPEEVYIVVATRPEKPPAVSKVFTEKFNAIHRRDELWASKYEYNRVNIVTRDVVSEN